MHMPSHHSVNYEGCFVAYSCTRIRFFGVGENDILCFALWYKRITVKRFEIVLCTLIGSFPSNWESKVCVFVGIKETFAMHSFDE